MSKDKKSDHSGSFIPGGLFIGLGLGLLFGNVAAGLFVGLGTGFIAMAISRGKKH